jgi:hypothetical protein
MRSGENIMLTFVHDLHPAKTSNESMVRVGVNMPVVMVINNIFNSIGGSLAACISNMHFLTDRFAECNKG